MVFTRDFDVIYVTENQDIWTVDFQSVLTISAFENYSIQMTSNEFNTYIHFLWEIAIVVRVYIALFYVNVIFVP